MTKLNSWLHERRTQVYINDENDEVITEYTNAQVLTGITSVFTILLLICVFCS